jgi:hypothetical protein
MKLSLGTAVTDILAARRLNRLITEDEITRPIREAHAVQRHEKLSYLLNCPYCVGVYTSAAVALSSIVFPRGSRILRYALAIAEVNATLKDIESQRQALVDAASGYGPPL